MTISFKRKDSGVDVQSVVSSPTEISSKGKGFKNQENRLGYDFRSDEFLISHHHHRMLPFLMNLFMVSKKYLLLSSDYMIECLLRKSKITVNDS